MTDLEPRITDRGFKHFDEVPSEYGGGVRTYESSMAEYPCLWVMVKQPADLNRRDSPQIEAVAHLTLENAALLRDQLTHLIDNHYQL